MSYASGADLIQRYDVDVIGMLCQDDREEIDREVIATHANVQAALDDASGEIDVKLLAGGRYSPAQLSGLTGNSASLLKRVTCAIAMSFLFQRRTLTAYEQLAEQVAKQAREYLKALAAGENIFGIEELVDGTAGTITTETVEAIDIENLRLMPGRMSRYFPGTAQRTPLT